MLNTAKALAEEGCRGRRSRASARTDGSTWTTCARSSTDSAAVVSVMLANNETGVLQPVAEAARLAHERGALVHCDAVQAAGKIPLDVRALDVDLLTLSAHKLYGPRASAASTCGAARRSRRSCSGGAQERNRRAGTENVAGIVGFGAAASLARDGLAAETERIGALRDRLEARLLRVPGARRNGGLERLANTANVSFEGVDAEALVIALDLEGVAASTGAACAAGGVEPSHVLKAMGFPPERVQSSLRLSLGRGTTEDEVDRAADVIVAVVAARGDGRGGWAAKPPSRSWQRRCRSSRHSAWSGRARRLR